MWLKPIETYIFISQLQLTAIDASLNISIAVAFKQPIKDHLIEIAEASLLGKGSTTLRAVIHPSKGLFYSSTPGDE